MKITKLLAVAMILLSCLGIAHDDIDQHSDKAMPKISVQLWSVKDELKNNFKGTLKQIASMGFDGVEFAGDFGPYQNDAQGLKGFLDNLGLKVSAAHISFAAFDSVHFDESVAFYKTLKTDTLIVAWDERAWDALKVDSLIVDLNKLFIDLKAEGFHFGFHNHDKEFNTHKDSTFWDHIAQSTPKDFVLQMDVGWVTLAGKDPVDYINRYPGRTLTTHIKAKLPKEISSVEGMNGKRPIVGDDITHWPGVLKADIAVGGTKWFVVEQEEYPDGLTPLEAVKLSKQGLDRIIADM